MRMATPSSSSARRHSSQPPPPRAASTRQYRPQPRGAVGGKKTDIVPEPWSRSSATLPPRASYRRLSDDERLHLNLPGPPVFSLDARCGPKAQRPRVPTLCEAVGRFSSSLRRAPPPLPPPPPTLPLRRPEAPSHLTANDASAASAAAAWAVSYDEEEQVFARSPNRQPLICSSHTRAAHERRKLSQAAIDDEDESSESEDEEDARQQDAQEEDEEDEDAGETPTPGGRESFGTLRDRYMRAFGKGGGASSKASPDSA